MIFNLIDAAAWAGDAFGAGSEGIGVSLWEAIFDWKELSSRGTDAVAYFVMAMTGTILFLVRLGLSAFGGDDGGDFDVDVDAGQSEASFAFFSLLSILAFFMGAGWMGLACRIDWNLGSLASGFIAAGFGTTMMLFASGLTYATRRLNKQIDYDVKTAIGRTGRVYLSIPEKGKGHGQVEVTVSGRRKIIRAGSTGPAIEAFADVTVVNVQDDESLVVEPKP